MKGQELAYAISAAPHLFKTRGGRNVVRAYASGANYEPLNVMVCFPESRNEWGLKDFFMRFNEDGTYGFSGPGSDKDILFFDGRLASEVSAEEFEAAALSM